MITAWVYILECADGAYYVGSHRGPGMEQRVAQHNAGAFPGAFTASRRPVRLLWAEMVSRYDDAVAFERRVKGWRREKKEALIRGDLGALVDLAKRPGVRKS